MLGSRGEGRDRPPGLGRWVWGKACLALASLCSRCKGLSNLFPRGSFADENMLLLTPRQLAGEGPAAGSREEN